MVDIKEIKKEAIRRKYDKKKEAVSFESLEKSELKINDTGDKKIDKFQEQTRIQEEKDKLQDDRNKLIKEKQEFEAKQNSWISELKDKESKLIQNENTFNTKVAQLATEKYENIKKLNDELSTLNKDIETAKSKKLKVDSEVQVALSSKVNDIAIQAEKEQSKITEDLMVKHNALIKNLENEYKDLSKKRNDTLQKLFDDTKKDIESEYKSIVEYFKTTNDINLGVLNDKIALYESKIEEYKKYSSENDKLQIQIAENKQEKYNNDRFKKEMQKKIEEKVEAEILIKYDDLNNKIESLEAVKKSNEKTIRDLRDKNAEYVAKQTSFDELDKMAEYKATVDKLSLENKYLLDKYAKYMNAPLANIDDLKKQLAQMQEVEANLREEYEALKNSLNDKNKKIEELECNLNKREFNETKVLQMDTELRRLKDQVREYAERYESKYDEFTSWSGIESPNTQFKEEFELDRKTGGENRINEEPNWLKFIYEQCEEAHYIFPKRLLYAFHTSLKSSDMSPICVLAGVSGTGKSKLPQLYSQFGGFYFVSIPVQPDWDSPQSLFGFYNTLERRFIATEVLRSMVSFQAKDSTSPSKSNILDLSNNMLIVLLDEMNLAYVELYFSDLLSKLEEKRGNDKKVSLKLDVGVNSDYEVFLGDNVKWVGTMNEDETTKSLSDKVIDRGNVISFPQPKDFATKPKSVVPAENKLSKSTWDKWIQTSASDLKTDLEPFKLVITDVNKSLKKVGRALGHRVWQSIESYMINHPIVIQYKKTDNKTAALKYAFEEAVVFKVISKLRGIETDGDLKASLIDIKESLSKQCDYILKDFDEALNNPNNVFNWTSSDYLDIDFSEVIKEKK